MSNSYSSKLRDARWQRKRLEIMKRDEFRCRCCYSGEEDEITLNVHHAYYESGLNPWEYPDDSLTTLCSVCHESVSSAMKSATKAIGSQKFTESIESVCMLTELLANNTPETSPAPYIIRLPEETKAALAYQIWAIVELTVSAAFKGMKGGDE